MDAVFDAQFRIIKDAFAARGVEVAVAYTPAGEVDYLYEVGRLLARDGDVRRITAALPPGLERLDRRGTGDLAVLSLDAVAGGTMTVPEALARIEDRLGTGARPIDRRPGRPPAAGEEPRAPIASPVHVLHISRLCPGTEPEVPPGNPAIPWPPPCEAGEVVRDVTIGVCDTGWLQLDVAAYPWLSDVSGDPEPLGPPSPISGLPRIPAFRGHGTFVAGVAKCQAPTARVSVVDHFSTSGAELEDVMIAKLDQLVTQSPAPDVINLSAGTYTRDNWSSLGFELFQQAHPDVVLVAAAGNDGTDRPFYPAAYDWAVSVGALGPDQTHLAWFSNYGPWVDVYALGEGHVNAYATGEYTYQEPPKRPAVQNFAGMARWDGTSFAAPLVAGLIADRMARTGESAQDARAAVLASAQDLPGVGKVLFPCGQP
ncbi:S8 family serine peptidase [Nonomuraea sp. NPDC048826]|uniref:S8 family peptidase n=1 Tax=Nonomuraea sp. NPDC048826 TaxID=3364347 RepID=UPI0037242032